MPTVVNFAEDAVVKVIAVLQPLVQNISSESGQPLSYPLRAVWNDARMTFPEITVDVLLGASQASVGNNLLDWDGASGMATYAQRASGSRIVLTIFSRSTAERDYVCDTLLSGLRAGYDLDARGNPIEGVVPVALAQFNIVLTGIEALQKPDPDRGEVRPEGLIYRATLTLIADITSCWQTPGYAAPLPYTLRQSFTSEQDITLTDPLGPVEPGVGTSVYHALQPMIYKGALLTPGQWQVVADSATTYHLQSYSVGAWSTLSSGLLSGIHYLGLPGQPYVPGLDLLVATTPPLVPGDSASFTTAMGSSLLAARSFTL